MKIKLNRWEWKKLLRRGRLTGGFKLLRNSKTEAVVLDENHQTLLVVCR